MNTERLDGAREERILSARIHSQDSEDFFLCVHGLGLVVRGTRLGRFDFDDGGRIRLGQRGEQAGNLHVCLLKLPRAVHLAEYVDQRGRVLGRRVNGAVGPCGGAARDNLDNLALGFAVAVGQGDIITHRKFVGCGGENGAGRVAVLPSAHAGLHGAEVHDIGCPPASKRGVPGHPRLRVHELLHGLDGHAGHAAIDMHEASPDAVERVGDLAHFGGVANSPAPRVVDHEVGRLWDRALAASEEWQRRGGCGDAVNNGLNVASPGEIVVERQTLEDIAALAVDPHADGTLHGLDLINERRGRHTPSADVAVDGDFGGCCCGLGADGEPRFHSVGAVVTSTGV